MDSVTYPSTAHWRDLYRAALLETDGTKLPGRIADAELAIVARAKMLFGSGDIDEDQALANAMYILNALRSSIKTSKVAA